MGTLINDVRYAVRSLLRTPAFTVVAVLTLALGIGANTAIFSVLYGVLLRPLPFPEPEQLVGLSQTFRGGRGEMGVTYSQFRFIADNNRVLESFAASTSLGMNLFAGGESQRVNAVRVSRDYFHVLGIDPEIGRGFAADEDVPGGARVVLLSHVLWRRSFASSPDIVGRAITLDGNPYTVVGVMPAAFRGDGADLWSTIAQVAATVGSGQNLSVVGRLRPGLTAEAARSAWEPTVAAFKQEFTRIFAKEAGIELTPYRELVAGDRGKPVKLLFGAIGLVLLIACANVANLVLGRASGRGRELALRVALGASRGRLVAQLLTESVVLALAGGALGIVFASWGLGSLLSLVADTLPQTSEIRIDFWALAFTFGVSLFTGIVFGLLPAWQVARRDLQASLKEAGRATGSTRQARLRHGLVVLEMALSLILLIGAGLLIRTFGALMRTDPGFQTGHLVSAEIWLAGSGYDSTTAIADYYRALSERVGALPGVQAVAVVQSGLPLQRGGNLAVTVDGVVPPRAWTDYRTVTPGYFATLGVGVKEGRGFEATDVQGAEPVVVVNEMFARQYFAGASPIGHMVKLGGSTDVPRRVVGVVGNVRSFIGNKGNPAAYLPAAQTPAPFTRLFGSWFPTHVLVRTAGDPAAVQGQLARVIRDVDARVPVGRVRTMEEVLSASLAFQRFVMLLLTVFAGLALGLAAIGIYGVIAYLVAQRTHEIGVRMALGARSADVVRMVLRRGLVLAGAGAAIGLAASLGLARLLGSLLYDTRPNDLGTYAVVTTGLVAVALLACWLPARRASRTDPIIALRTE